MIFLPDFGAEEVFPLTPFRVSRGNERGLRVWQPWRRRDWTVLVPGL